MAMDSDLASMGLVELGRQIDRRKLSPVEVTRFMLERIERLQPKLKCYATVMAEQAVRQARRCEREIMQDRVRGPLHGVPVAVKDLCNTKGTVTAAGIPMFRNRVPTHDATVVTRLREAGAVLLGKLQLTEGALALHHPSVDPPVNPWSRNRWSGASSSGAGAASAAGLAYGTLGSDTGGSIRFPAFANGVVGLKPTWGRVSRYGVFPLSETLDHVGPLTRSVEDAAAMLRAIAGRDRNDPSSSSVAVPNYLRGIRKGIKGVRVGFDRKYAMTGAHPEVRKMLERVLRTLKAAGAVIVTFTMPDTKPAIDAWTPICTAEAALAHADSYPAKKRGYSDVYSGFLTAGRAVTGMEYARAEIARRNFRGQMNEVFQSIDLMLTPIVGILNPTIKEFYALCAKENGLANLIYYTCVNNMTGAPTITLPAGLDKNGSPLAFQLVGRHFEEMLLCRAGYVWQSAADWRGLRPPLAA